MAVRRAGKWPFTRDFEANVGRLGELAARRYSLAGPTISPPGRGFCWVSYLPKAGALFAVVPDWRYRQSLLPDLCYD